MKATTFFVPVLAAAYASAHGHLSRVTIAGQEFKGNRPQARNDPSIIHQISDPSPIKGANNAAMTCGKDASRAALVGDAQPGDTVTFDWRGADGTPWPHNTGPSLTYMASCGSSSCTDFNPSNAKWFKIEQTGRKSDGNWAQGDLMRGDVSTIELPNNIRPGEYLIRHEIISLHLGTSPGGAEFYPACAQIKIGGNGNGAPRDDEVVTFPGGYSDNDKGILVPDIFNTRVEYVFPGPRIAAFVNDDAPAPSTGGNTGSGSGSGSGSSSASRSGSATRTATSTNAAPTSTSTSSPSNNNSNSGGAAGPSKCKLKKRTNPVTARAVEETGSLQYYPRHYSRIMRNLAFGKSH